MTTRARRRRLRLEALETRATPAVIVVDSLGDVSTADGHITLREAINAARHDRLADAVEGTQRGFGADEIRFDPALFTDGPAALRLTRGVPLEVAGGLDDALRIVGPGSGLLTVDADVPSLGLGNGPGMHHFRVMSDAATTIEGMRLTGAYHRTDGAIAYGSDLTLIDLVIEDNTTRGDGAAISSLLRTETHADPDATLRIESSVIRDNELNRTSGSIVEVRGGTLEIIGSSIVGNWADGPGIVLAESGFGGTLGGVTIENSTLSGNTGSPVLSVETNVVETRIAWSTITNNEVGVVGVASSAAQVVVEASIVADNGLRNLDIDSRDGTTALVVSHSLTDTAPLLAPLRDNGGSLPTHALLPGSPAIDRVFGDFNGGEGDDNGGSIRDQRGLPRGVEGDGDSPARSDIGAYEAQGVPGFTAGDYTRDGVVDAADYALWRDAFTTGDLAADGDGDLDVDADDRTVWASAYGSGLTETPVVAPVASVDDAASARDATSFDDTAAPVERGLLLYLASLEAQDDEEEPAAHQAAIAVEAPAPMLRGLA